MRVILLQDIGSVGKRNEVKDVSDGYALNFLIPRGLVEQATPERFAAHEKRMAERVALQKEEERKLAKGIQSLENVVITLKVRATERGGLFKSIGAKEIVEVIEKERGVKVPEAVIKLSQPIKTVGEHPVRVAVEGAKASIKIAIVAA